ncbi:hypothetical protein [Dehalogenimonas alkenigignens]|uniref:hypothetical protein n=1 Tax=Dehalogenimonas alkenigignens TaxID=1217799 RepID=UPI000D56F317|nr:hypothetical protein [Dehalogenimonas alkenigignens]PVV82567.1 hypothetical protein DD509_08500 [Dehalogenimonas alkenigignens]
MNWWQVIRDELRQFAWFKLDYQKRVVLEELIAAGDGFFAVVTSSLAGQIICACARHAASIDVWIDKENTPLLERKYGVSGFVVLLNLKGYLLLEFWVGATVASLQPSRTKIQ